MGTGRFLVKNVVHIVDKDYNIDELKEWYIGIEKYAYYYDTDGRAYKFTFNNLKRDAVILKDEKSALDMIKVLKGVYPNYRFEKEEI